MAIQKLWYVVKLNQAYVPQEFAVQPAMQWEEPPARNRNGIRAAAQAPANNGVVKQKLESKNTIKEAFTTEEAAEAEAKELASKNPKEPYAVLGIIKVYETVPAEPIKKQFSETGELVVSTGN